MEAIPFRRDLFVAIPYDTGIAAPVDVHHHRSLGYRTTALRQRAGEEFGTIWDQDSYRSKDGVRHYTMPYTTVPYAHHLSRDYHVAAAIASDLPSVWKPVLAHLFTTTVMTGLARSIADITPELLFQIRLRTGELDVSLHECAMFHQAYPAIWWLFFHVGQQHVIEVSFSGEVLVIKYLEGK